MSKKSRKSLSRNPNPISSLTSPLNRPHLHCVHFHLHIHLHILYHRYTRTMASLSRPRLALSSESNTPARAHYVYLVRLNRRSPLSFYRSRNAAAEAVEAFLRAESLPDRLSPRSMRLGGIPHPIALYIRNYVDQLGQSTLYFAKVARYITPSPFPATHRK